MINPFQEINWQPDDKAIRKFGLTILIGFPVIALVFFLINLSRMPCQSALKVPIYIAATGVIVFLIATMLPKAALPLYYAWFFLSACIGIVVSNLILIVIFYVLLTPFAIVFRVITGRDPLQLRKTAKDSFWVKARRERALKKYLKQY